ncbi:hypothetical protein SBY92_000510 [Candida maltosa Xu316]
MNQLFDTSHPPSYYTGILKNIDRSPSYELVKALSYHADPNLQWCSSENAQIVNSILDSFDYHPFIPQLIHQFKETSKRIIKRTEPDNSVLLSQAWFLIDYGYNEEVSVLATLSAIDFLSQSIPSKIQAFKLLDHLPQLNESLMKDLKKAIKSCLVHVPPITPFEQSLDLLTHAYSWIYKLNVSNIDNIETISTILSTLNSSPIQHFLLEQLSKFVTRLGIDVFISTSKIFYTLNQLILSIDSRTENIVLALKIEQDIIDLNHEFLLTYTYDFIGAWTIVSKRGNPTIQTQLSQNVSSLKKLAKDEHEISELCTYIVL